MAKTIREANDFLESRSLSPKILYSANLILEEILTNIVKYAFDGEEPRLIDVKVVVEPEQVIIETKDDGVAFDPTLVKSPELKESLMDCEPGGLGIHLVLRTVHEISYRREKARNVLTMRIRLDED
jgi:serine/threonine-protein kinase RsbW